MTTEGTAGVQAGSVYREAEAVVRRMSDQDLLRVARGLSFAGCDNREVAANQEVNRRFERLRERVLVLDNSMDGLRHKHAALQERFDTLMEALQQALALLASGDSGSGAVAAEMVGARELEPPTAAA